MTTIPITNFTKGEISPELQARIDTSQYGAGTKRMSNFMIQRYGGASFRPGFRLVGEVDDVTKNIRYMPFQFNIEQAYVMALEDERMRFLAGGGIISEQNLKITAITKAANAQLTVAYHDYEIGERIFFSGIVGMIELNGLTGTVMSTPTDSTFTVNINSTGFTTFISSDGDVRAGPPAPPEPPPPPPPVVVPPPPEPVVFVGGGSGSSIGILLREFNYGYVREP